MFNNRREQSFPYRFKTLNKKLLIDDTKEKRQQIGREFQILIQDILDEEGCF